MQVKEKVKSERGQAMTEMVIIFPFLAVLIAGIVLCGLILQRQIAVVSAAREGARFGAFGAESEDIYANTVIAALGGLLSEDSLTVVVIQVELAGPAPSPRIVTWDVYPAGASPSLVSQEQILEAMRIERPTDFPAANFNEIEMVIVDVVYEYTLFWGPTIPIGSWTVMRTHG